MYTHKHTYIYIYRRWLGYYSASRKVGGSISDEVIGLVNWPTPSSPTMSVGSTQSLTEISTRNLRGVKGGRRVRLTNLPSSMSRLYRQCGSLDVSQPYRPPRSATGIPLYALRNNSIYKTYDFLNRWRNRQWNHATHLICWKVVVQWWTLTPDSKICYCDLSFVWFSSFLSDKYAYFTSS
jgi:hypothetical protein